MKVLKLYRVHRLGRKDGRLEESTERRKDRWKKEDNKGRKYRGSVGRLEEGTERKIDKWMEGEKDGRKYKGGRSGSKQKKEVQRLGSKD